MEMLKKIFCCKWHNASHTQDGCKSGGESPSFPRSSSIYITAKDIDLVGNCTLESESSSTETPIESFNGDHTYYDFSTRYHLYSPLNERRPKEEPRVYESFDRKFDLLERKFDSFESQTNSLESVNSNEHDYVNVFNAPGTAAGDIDNNRSVGSIVAAINAVKVITAQPRPEFIINIEDARLAQSVERAIEPVASGQQWQHASGGIVGRFMPTLRYIRMVRPTVVAINEDTIDVAISVDNYQELSAYMNFDEEEEKEEENIYESIDEHGFLNPEPYYKHFFHYVLQLHAHPGFGAPWLQEYLKDIRKIVAYFKSHGDDSLPCVPFYPIGSGREHLERGFLIVFDFLCEVLLVENRFWSVIDFGKDSSRYGYFARYFENAQRKSCPDRLSQEDDQDDSIWLDGSPRFHEVY